MDYSAALLEQNRLFGEAVAAGDEAAEVPSCPGWTLRQLFRHVGRGDRWAAQIVAERRDSPLDPRGVHGGKPPEDLDGALDWLHGGAQAMLDAVRETGPDTPVWTFLGPRPAAWWIRRRLHEATVHRADAALALGVEFELAAPLAADGISEWLGLIAARPAAATGPLDAGTSLHLHATDGDLGVEGEWTIRAEGAELTWEHGHSKCTAAARGRAVDLLLALLRRRSAEEANVELLGDESVWSAWLERTGF
ncbi:MAG TPA: maleylpyruvate isomerase family mycothiol-dependent enzyme [Pseudonocardia sp.]|jgi:uncharacterized protein (TIGR03083 family)